MYVASITNQGTDNDGIRGWVASMEDGLTVAIVCYRVDGEWTPMYGIKRNPEPAVKIGLPGCFTLDPRAKQALEEAYQGISCT